MPKLFMAHIRILSENKQVGSTAMFMLADIMFEDANTAENNMMHFAAARALLRAHRKLSMHIIVGNITNRTNYL